MPAELTAEGYQENANSRYFTYLFWAVPLILAVMAATLTIDGHFVQDDKSAVLGNPLVVNKTAAFSDYFDHDSWGFPVGGAIAVWRPLLPGIWRMIWAIEPANPLAFRLLTVLLHLMTTAIVLLLGRRLVLERRIVWAAGALFAVHPLHAEAIGEIVGQADILSTFFGLLALYVALGRKPALAPFLVSGLLIAACSAKESAVVFSALVAVIVLLEDDAPLSKRLGISISAAMVTLLTILVQFSIKRVEVSPLANIAFVAHGGQKILHALYIIGRALSMCFVPVGMSPFHDYAAVDLSMTTLLPYAIPGILFLGMGIAAVVISLKKRSIAGIIGTGLLFGPVIINSSLIVTVQTELADRLLYPATVAAAAMAAFVVYRAIGPRFGTGAVAVLILLFSTLGWSAQRPWRNQRDLYAHAVEAEPLSATLRMNHGMNLLSIGDVPDAAWHFMVRTYILSHFPDRVDPTPIFQLEQLPVEQRILEAPEVFAPKGCCRFLNNYFKFLEGKTPHLAPFMRSFLLKRYPGCSGSTSGRVSAAKP